MSFIARTQYLWSRRENPLSFNHPFFLLQMQTRIYSFSPSCFSSHHFLLPVGIREKRWKIAMYYDPAEAVTNTPRIPCMRSNSTKSRT